jgi:hypothetical protein
MNEAIEIVVDKNGEPRQAGATDKEGAFIKEVKSRAEKSLYYFAKAILKRGYLNPRLHSEVAQFLTKTPPFRKLLLLPREHAKTSIVSHALPCHAIIQPKENNIYVKGKAGVDTRILLAGETLDRAGKNLSTIQTGIFENNSLFRALWPHAVWETKPAKRWNANEMVVPRNIDYPDPTIQALGVDGAVTGGRFDIAIRDDLISLKAANSSVEMNTAIRWMIASRALYESDTTLEFTIGTRWAVFDIYSFMLEGGVIDGENFGKDYTVATMVRSLIEDGEVIYPEKFSLEVWQGKQDVEMLKRQYGLLFYLNYMNSAANPELTDFDISNLRYYTLQNGYAIFDPGEDSNEVIGDTLASTPKLEDELRGKKLSKDLYDVLKERKEYLRLRR